MQGDSFLCEKVVTEGTIQEQETPLNLEIDCEIVDEIPPTKPLDLSVKIKTEPLDDYNEVECLFTPPYIAAEATQIAIAIENSSDPENSITVGLNKEGEIRNVQSGDNAYGVITTTSTGVTTGSIIEKKSIKRKIVKYVCKPVSSYEQLPEKIYRCTKQINEIHECPECDYLGTSHGNLTKHMRKHMEEKPFKCDLCKYQTAYNQNFEYHMRRHNKEYLKCEQCIYQTVEKHALKIHMRKHTKEKPFKCNQCKYQVTARRYLTKHMTKTGHDSK